MASNLFDLVDCNDGFSHGMSDNPMKMVIMRRSPGETPLIRSIDDSAPAHLVDEVYQYSLINRRPWGVFVEMTNGEVIGATGGSDIENSLATRLFSEIFLGTARDMVQPILQQLCGAAIWCLTSFPGDSVSYHIDYSEIFRMETNIIFPPLLAGTLHVSPLNLGDMEGGKFCVNSSGLNHYLTCGFKGKLLNSANAIFNDTNVIQSVSSVDPATWHEFLYQYRRSVIFDGQLPHYSTPVKVISSSSSSCDRRVIVGFNLFSDFSCPNEPPLPAISLRDVLRRATEHSTGFVKTVRLYQGLSRYSSHKTNDGDSKLTFEKVMKNDKLKKLIVILAKQKKKMMMMQDQDDDEKK